MENRYYLDRKRSRLHPVREKVKCNKMGVKADFPNKIMKTVKNES
jgi:hypothetical protein